MYCLFGLIGTLLMGLLGREVWSDARAWRHFSWSTAPSGPAAPGAWPSGSTQRCAGGDSLACRNCPVHRG